METLSQTPLEKTLLDWAEHHRYVIRERKTPEERDHERCADKQVERKGSLQSRLLALVGLDESRDFTRHIWTPTGLAEYKVSVCGTDEIPTEQDLARDITQGCSLPEQIIVYHGANVKDWKSERIPTEDRRKKDKLRFDLVLEGEERINPFNFRIDFVYNHQLPQQALYDLFEPLEGLVDLGRAIKLIPNKERTIPLPMKSFDFPNTPETYRKILNCVAGVISSRRE